MTVSPSRLIPQSRATLWLADLIVVGLFRYPQQVFRRWSPSESRSKSHSLSTKKVVRCKMFYSSPGRIGRHLSLFIHLTKQGSGTCYLESQLKLLLNCCQTAFGIPDIACSFPTIVTRIRFHNWRDRHPELYSITLINQGFLVARYQGL